MSRRPEGPFTIGGDDRGFPTSGVALSVAQNRACHRESPVSIGVFEHGAQIARVERRDDGVVITTRLEATS